MKFNTMQAYFNQAVAFFSVMPRQSTDGEAGSCVYYNPATEDACILGQFMDDKLRTRYVGILSDIFCDMTQEELDQVIPGATGLHDFIHNDKYYYDDNGFDLDALDEQYPGLGLAADLQRVHDEADNWDENGFIGWEHLKAVADCYLLTFTQPDLTIRTDVPIEAEKVLEISGA